MQNFYSNMANMTATYGRVSMTYCPPFGAENANILNVINSLDDDVTNANDIYQYEKDELTAHYLDELGRDAYLALCEAKDVPKVIEAFKKCLFSNSETDNEAFLTEIKNSTFNYFKKHINELISER